MKIVFILNSVSTPHSYKRIDEFVENGYSVDVYGFSRGDETKIPADRNVEIIGDFDTNLPYSSRLPLMVRSIKNVVRKYTRGGEKVIFYLFQLDVALAFKLCCSKSYIYEEPDLMHTYISNKLIRNLLDLIDKYIIKKSLITVFTSEGFVKYHYSDRRPQNIYIIPNRLNPMLSNFAVKEKCALKDDSLKIGFVGGLRFKAIKNFIDVFCRRFPNYEFHSYGTIGKKMKEDFEALEKYSNYFYHGSFNNPVDLSGIYSNIDLVLSTYDAEFENVRYAEPNKLYEAIYFETPIIVSKGTFLEEKVNRLGVGFCVDAMNENEIVEFVSNLSRDKLYEKISSCRAVPKKECLNINDDFFKKIKDLI